MTMNALAALLLLMAARAGFLEFLNRRGRLRARALLLEANFNVMVNWQHKAESPWLEQPICRPRDRSRRTRSGLIKPPSPIELSHFDPGVPSRRRSM